MNRRTAILATTTLLLARVPANPLFPALRSGHRLP